MQEFTDTAVGATDHRTMQKRLQYLDEQNRALVSIQDKLERLSDFRSDMILSHDIPEILQSGIAKFQELVKTERVYRGQREVTRDRGTRRRDAGK